jgi:hypothetical protein
MNPNIKRLITLLPELEPYLYDDGPMGWTIHSPLLIRYAVDAEDPTVVKELYLRKKALRDEFLKEVRFRPMRYLGLIEKPYRLDALYRVRNKIGDAQYWRGLAYVWTIMEKLHHNKPKWLRLFRSDRRYRALMMNRDERKEFALLPDTLKIYRGYQHGRYRNRLGLSWTVSLKTATWFAYRFPQNGKPTVICGECRKEDVFCYLNDRNEEEIVIDPAMVADIRYVEDIGPSPFE